MSQAQSPPRPSSPQARAGRSSVPWFTTRVVSLFLAWCWGIIGAAAGINALVKSNDQKSAINKAIPRPTIITINVRDVYVLGVLTSTACILIVVFTSTFLGMTLCRPKSFRRTLFFQAVLLMSSSAWLFSVLVPLTIFHAKRSAKVNAYLDGIQLPSYIVNTVENALDITSVYKRIQYLRIAVVLPWFTFLFTLFAAIILFITSSHVDRLEQSAHEEIHARIGVHTNKISTVDLDNNNANLKEGTGPGLRRSPMLVSEKSGSGNSPRPETDSGTAGSITVDSPDTGKSHSLAESSPQSI